LPYLIRLEENEVMRFTRNLRFLKSIRIMIAVVMLTGMVAACGGDDDDNGGEDTAAPTTASTDSGSADPTATSVEDDTDTGDGTFGIDLSGVELRLTGAQPSALSMIDHYMEDLMEGWGADIDRIELTGTTGVQALIAGQTDLAGGGTDELILGAAAGADIVAIASTQDKMDYVLVASNDIQSIADLDGKSIGMSGPAGYDTLLSRLVIRREGMALDDVNFVQIGGSGDRSAALLAGRVDAATIFISDWFELELRTDDVHALAFMNEVVDSSTKSSINTTKTFAAENPEVMFALACANLEAYKWFHDSKDAFIEYTLENVEGSTEEATSALYDQLLAIEMYPLDVDELLEPEGVQEVADIMFESGEITTEVNGEDLVDRSFLEQAAAAGCGQ
jgi:NitT/TauT family transport system substrate-binding protein